MTVDIAYCNNSWLEKCFIFQVDPGGWVGKVLCDLSYRNTYFKLFEKCPTLIFSSPLPLPDIWWNEAVWGHISS